MLKNYQTRQKTVKNTNYIEIDAPRGSESIFYLLEYLNMKLANIKSSRNNSIIYKPPEVNEYNKPINDQNNTRKDMRISNKLILIYLDIEYNIYQIPPTKDERFFMKRVCQKNDKACLWEYKNKPSVANFNVGLGMNLLHFVLNYIK